MAKAGSSAAFNVGLVILGSILALGTSFAIEVWRNRRADRRKVFLLKNLLRNEIPVIINIVEAVLRVGKEDGHFPAGILKSIYSAREGFDRHREWIVLIKDNNLRQELFNFYCLVDATCREAEWFEALIEQAPPGTRKGPTIERRDLIIQQYESIIERGEGLLKRIEEL